LKNNIIWTTYDNSLRLTTKNLVKGFKFKNEKLIYRDQNELRLWKPYRSKLAAGIINGLEIIPLSEDSRILYFGIKNGITLNHMSDIVGQNGKIFAISEQIDYSLKNLSKIKENIILLEQDKSKNFERLITEKVDLLFVDLPETNYSEIIINFKKFLHDSGFLIFIFRTKDARVKNKNSENKLDLFDELNSNFQIIQIINLTDFFKEFSMVLAKNKN
tara:strand:- start:4425 stop:5075 length:651 start_codon:yes stop_codon:yes gene_type:complete